MGRKGLSKHTKELSLLVNLSINSLRLDKLTLEEKTGPKEIRPQLHAILHAPKSSLKSTILDTIGDTHGVETITDISFPGLVGSAEKLTGQFIPGVAWDYRRKPLLLDEWAESDERKKLVNALLQLTEGGHFARKLGIRTNEFSKKDGPFHIKVKDGWIIVRTRFSLTLATMHDIRRSTNKDIQALISRCVPYSFTLSEDEIDAALQGYPLYEPKIWEFPKEATIDNRTYSRIIKLAHSADIAIRPRAVGDLCRAYAMLGWDKDAFKFIIDCKNNAETEFRVSWEQYKKKIAGFGMHDVV